MTSLAAVWGIDWAGRGRVGSTVGDVLLVICGDDDGRLDLRRSGQDAEKSMGSYSLS